MRSRQAVYAAKYLDSDEAIAEYITELAPDDGSSTRLALPPRRVA